VVTAFVQWIWSTIKLFHVLGRHFAATPTVVLLVVIVGVTPLPPHATTKSQILLTIVFSCYMFFVLVKWIFETAQIIFVCPVFQRLVGLGY
jgi:hypothetical protein